MHITDVTPILKDLNDAQRQAVTAPLEPLLVIAGAGSGNDEKETKTKKKTKT